MSLVAQCHKLLSFLTPQRESSSRCHLGLEPLEDRWVPAVFRYRPESNFLWAAGNTVASNWEVQNPFNTALWDRAAVGEFPGSDGRTNDTARFDAAADNCTMNVTITLKTLRIESTYLSRITLEHTLTIKNGSLPGEGLMTRSGEAVIAGNQDLRLLQLENSRFIWNAGTLSNLRVIVDQDSKVILPESEGVFDSENTYLRMESTHLDVEDGGSVEWRWRNVTTGIAAGAVRKSLVHVFPGGTFKVEAANKTWGSGPTSLEVRNEGDFRVQPGTLYAPGRATFGGSFNNLTVGKVSVERGVLEVTGPMLMVSGEIELYQGAKVRLSSTESVLDVTGGTLGGTGTVEGNVVMAGLAILDPHGNSTPPGRGWGEFKVTGNLDTQLGGTITIDIYDRERYDTVTVTHKVILGGGTATGTKREFPPGTNTTPFRPRDRVVFLRSVSDVIQGEFAQPPTAPGGWEPGRNQFNYWFRQIGNAMGRVGGDANGNGVFEPGLGEQPLPGVPVALLNEDDEVVATTTTAADGSYEFDEVGFGTWTVEFTRPSDLRPVQPGAGDDEFADSDYDYATLTAGVTIDEANPFSNPYTDALFRPLTAVNDDYHVLSGGTIGGDVSLNDPPAAGDTLTFAHILESGPALGTLVFYNDGTFVYFAPVITGPAVVVSFQYLVTDSYGHTATATVYITIHPQSNEGGGDPPPPPP